MRVAVIGAGVSGLTTANVFQCAGHEVEVIAERDGLDSTSGAAGAMWLPIRLPEGSPRVAWALHSYGILRELAETTPEAGVDMVTACEVTGEEERPWWADHVIDARLTELAGIYPHAARAWTFQTPRVEPALYIPWLESQLERPITWRHVKSFGEIEADLVLNCSGLGARRLAEDPELVPVFGQTVICEPGTLPLETMLGDERDHDAIWYSIPRRAEVVLGGCRVEVDGEDDLPGDPALTEAIMARTRAAGYEPGPVLRVRTGLRPQRPEPRVEREGRVIHNYGHGGSGFALSWGCAQAALELAEGG